MPRTDQHDRERSHSFYARISAANIAHGAHTWPGSPSAVRRAPARPTSRDHAQWDALRIVCAALLLHVAGWTTLLATQGELPAVLLVMVAWFGAACWIGVQARTWWWPATWAIVPVALLVYASLITQDSDPDLAWFLLLLSALFVASLVPGLGAVIGVIVGRLVRVRDGKQAQSRN